MIFTVVGLFSRDSEACTHAAEERGQQENRHFWRYTTRSSAGIPSESRLTKHLQRRTPMPLIDMSNGVAERK
jgi:hypothetical protein